MTHASTSTGIEGGGQGAQDTQHSAACAGGTGPRSPNRDPVAVAAAVTSGACLACRPRGGTDNGSSRITAPDGTCELALAAHASHPLLHRVMTFYYSISEPFHP